jgi:hypothetical protein
MNDVVYAGADGAATAPPQPSATSERVPVHLDATEPDITYSVRSGSATIVGVAGGHAVAALAHGYTELCTAPCNASLPAGTQHLALSKGGGAPVEPEAPVSLSGPVQIHGDYHDRKGTRIAGVVTMVLGGVTGTLLMVTASKPSQDCSTGTCVTLPKIDDGQVAAGILVLSASAVLGIALVLQHDSAEISVVPLQTSSLPRPLMALREGASIPVPEGLALRVAF